MERSPSMRNAKCVCEHRTSDGWTAFDIVRTSEWKTVCKSRVGRILPTPKSSVALNSSVPANRLTSVAAVLKASSIPLEQWNNSERRNKRWQTTKSTHSLTKIFFCHLISINAVFAGVEIFCSMIQNPDFTWTAGHITGSGLCGCTGITAWPSSLLVPISTGDTAWWPVTPVPLSIHIVWIREKKKERSSALMHTTCLPRPASMPH